MKLEEMFDLRDDSIQALIKKLEDKGFYIRKEGESIPSKTHHKTLQARRRARSRAYRESSEGIEIRRARERRRQGTLKGKWRHLRRTYRKRGLELMSFEEWRAFWREAGSITLGDGSSKLAWKARGGYKGWEETSDCVQLRRWDTSLPWTLENTYAQWKGHVICNGFDVQAKLLKNNELLKKIEKDENNA